MTLLICSYRDTLSAGANRDRRRANPFRHRKLAVLKKSHPLIYRLLVHAKEERPRLYSESLETIGEFDGVKGHVVF